MNKQRATSWYGPDLESVPAEIGTLKLTEVKYSQESEGKWQGEITIHLGYSHPPFNGDEFNFDIMWVNAAFQDIFNDEDINYVIFTAHEAFIQYKSLSPEKMKCIVDEMTYIFECYGIKLFCVAKDDAVSLRYAK